MDSSKKTTIKLSRKIDLRGLDRFNGGMFLKINTTFNTHMLYQQYSFMYTKREF